MAGFRLKMAMQLGEKVASDNGFTEFPIDPQTIAKARDIDVVAKPSGMIGVSGALILANDRATIIYSSEYNNTGFEKFSIAHELGHYFLPGHPEEILRGGGTHVSRANFSQASSIELEADHFASGLLFPSRLVRAFMGSTQVGLEGVLRLADAAAGSRTAAAIRAAECCGYPIAVIVSEADRVAYAFMSDEFKQLGKLAYLKKGTLLPDTATRSFNCDPDKVLSCEQACGETSLADWFEGPRTKRLDEEVIGLGSYGYTLTVLSSEELPETPDDDEADEEEALRDSWTPRHAYGR